jgi:hypothetical protein
MNRNNPLPSESLVLQRQFSVGEDAACIQTVYRDLETGRLRRTSTLTELVYDRDGFLTGRLVTYYENGRPLNVRS